MRCPPPPLPPPPGLTSSAAGGADQLHAALGVGRVRSFRAGEVGHGAADVGAARSAGGLVRAATDTGRLATHVVRVSDGERTGVGHTAGCGGNGGVKMIYETLESELDVRMRGKRMCP